jgi:hypothetical protein
MEYKAGCNICGEELHYSQEQALMQCEYCGAMQISNVECPNGHFICDGCHQSTANELIWKYCLYSPSIDPMDMAVKLMKTPAIKMHGPEHHFLVPAVLVAAYYNKLGDARAKEKKLLVALKRAESVPGGYCGTHGTCGAAIGVGIFFSIITGSTPLSEKVWSLSNRITGESLLEIARHGGPRCCKRDSFLVIRKAVDSLRSEFNVKLPTSAVVCTFHHLNKQCKFENCIFYMNPADSLPKK